MRKYKHEGELADKAIELSESIVIRSYEGGCSKDERRESTDEESDKLFRLFYGVLLGLNYGEGVRGNDDSAWAVVNAAEFIAHQVWHDYEEKHNIDINWYDTLYLPLMKVLKDWEDEEDEE